MRGVEVSIPSSSGARPPMPAYAAVSSAEPGRGVVVIHELLGRQPEIDRVVDRFAAAGYAAVGPDLFADARWLTCMRRSLATIASGEGPMAERVDDARRWLCAESGVAEARVGVIGFCLGGGLALAVGRHFAGVSSNYGDLPPETVLRHSPPIIACYGGRDRAFGRNAGRLRQRADTLGLSAEIHLFPTVGHSFLTDGDHPLLKAASWPVFQMRWDPQVAEDGWARIMDFFARTL